MPYKNKEEQREHGRQYYQTHRAIKDAQARQWRIDHPGKAREWSRRWYEANRDRCKEVAHVWYEGNSEKVKEYGHRWEATHREMARTSSRQWRKEHPAQVRAIKQRRRAREIGVFADLTAQQWQDVLTTHDFRCKYCGIRFSEKTPPTMDHVIPLSRGGHHTATNIVPACLHCNCSKGAKTISA